MAAQRRKSHTKSHFRGRIPGRFSDPCASWTPSLRTYTDWQDPPPGFAEADLVAHSGLLTRGSFVQTLVLTDIATGWTERAPLLFRERTLVSAVLTAVRRLLPFDLLGLPCTYFST